MCKNSARLCPRSPIAKISPSLRGGILSLVACLGIAVCRGPASADVMHPADETIGSPWSAIVVPLDKAGQKAAAASMTATADVIPLGATGGEVSWDADIAYTDGQIFNPRTEEFDKVRLRSYQGSGVDPQVPFVAPTVKILPGEVFRIDTHFQNHV